MAQNLGEAQGPWIEVKKTRFGISSMDRENKVSKTIITISWKLSFEV